MMSNIENDIYNVIKKLDKKVANNNTSIVEITNTVNRIRNNADSSFTEIRFAINDCNKKRRQQKQNSSRKLIIIIRVLTSSLRI